jgi:hypothetical protein
VYLLAVLRTIQEGYSKKKGRADWGWHPEAFLKEISPELQATLKTTEAIKRQLTWTLTELLVDDTQRPSILAILRTFVEPLEYTHAFFFKNAAQSTDTTSGLSRAAHL